jgi:hypothetical protein
MELKTPTKSNLYDQDYCLWIETMAELLKNKQFSELDLENLIEEIEDMGRSQRDSLESNLIVVLLHLLKWKYQPQMRSGSWQRSIIEHRRRINKAFKDSPSLKRYFLEIYDEAYQSGRKQAAAETGLNLAIFPLENPFTREQMLDNDYLPD